MSAARDEVWIERFAEDGAEESGALLVGLKDLFDVEGSVTTAGCKAVADSARPALADASCVAALRQNGGRLVGKTNLHELAFGISGINPWYGTPPNPADPGRIPGGSSSGSAVAVARREADVALGTDTGGSVRIPAACCGVVGLKTTHGRISLDGVWPLAPSYDTVGPLARDVAGIVSAMELLEGSFTPSGGFIGGIGRCRLGGEVAIDPVVDDAVDEALRAASLTVRQVEIACWLEAWKAQQVLLCVEAFENDGHLLTTNEDGLGADTAERLRGSRRPQEDVEKALELKASFNAQLLSAVERHGLLALPTLPRRPPVVGEPTSGFNIMTAPVNMAGLPAISLPIPLPGRPPTGLQLVGPPGGEELVVEAAALLEETLAG